MTVLKQGTKRTASASSAARLSRVCVLGLGVLALALPLVLLQSVGSAHAADDATATPSATPSADPAPPATPPTRGPSASPAISSPASADLLSDSVTVSGSAQPGSGIQVSSSTQSDPLCTLTADDSGSFSCSSSSLPSAPNVALTVVQLVQGQANQSTSVTVNVLNAPTLRSGAAGGVSTGYGTVRGTAFAGATVTARGGGYSCSSVADGQGTWACNLGTGIPSGSITVRASQATGWSNGVSLSSSPLTLQIDSDPPAPPTITSPSASSNAPLTGAAISGTGEGGALVTVFAGSYAACTATVQGDTWSCLAGTVAAGNYPVSAIQQDAAGNVSDESAPFAVAFTGATGAATGGSASGSPMPSDAAGSPGGASPGTGSDAGTSDGGATSGASGSPGPTSSAGANGQNGGGSGGSGSGGDSNGAGGNGAGGSGTGAGSGSGAGGGASLAPGSANDPSAWAGATRFTSALQPVLQASPVATWLIAFLAALAVIALIAAPGRLLSAGLSRLRSVAPATVAPRLRSVARGATAPLTTATRARATTATQMPRVTGRNRSRIEFDAAPDVRLNPWLIAAGAVIVAAVIGMLSGPVANQPAYLRLLLALCAAFALLNAAGILLPRVLAKRWLEVPSDILFAPRYLLIAALAALASRVFDLQPAVLFGLLFTLTLTEGVSRTKQAQFALLQLAALVLSGSLAWLIVAVIPAFGSAAAAAYPLSTFANETLSTLALGAFSAAAVTVLPFGRMLGKTLFDWSKPAWFASAVVAFTLLAAVLVPSFEHAGRGVQAAQVILVGVAFAAVGISVWAWLKFVTPTLNE